ncbi:hypothetical protein [Oricola cellulosilytica]|uniref:Uncharacterized protein n=1 Tax=Oricola cellulosilytica TaxID=1429082 RepID=A0A4R0PHW8_9HYPH|nr:hypothetical protein [Oricola cellulosilytica]TCD15154.1 hypothetical protein E0D97_06290 [Oricola cellulosilytica]
MSKLDPSIEREFTRRRCFGWDPIDRFQCYFWFVGWWAISFGFHASLRDPNVEIHLPFGFVRIGWVGASARRFEKCLDFVHRRGEP